jgi:hypothetical protein
MIRRTREPVTSPYLPGVPKPAAMKLTVTNSAAREEIWLPPHVAQQFHLHEVQWVDVRVSHVDRATKDRIRPQQAGLRRRRRRKRRRRRLGIERSDAPSKKPA